MLWSASTVNSQRQYGSSWHFVQHQLVFGVLPGALIFWGIRRLGYQRIKPWALGVLFTALVLMVLVLVPSVGTRLKGATSWLSLGGVSVQPAEVLKLALIIYLAAWLGERNDRMKHWQLGLLPFGVIMVFVCLLLLLQPDLGTLGIVLCIAGGMYMAAGAPVKHMALISGCAVIVVAGFAFTSPLRWARVTTLFNPLADARGAGWQLNQSYIAIGSGGLLGKGLGHSTQKFGFLPEPFGDSIFAVIVEELGLVGGLATITLFAGLIGTLFIISFRAHDGFGSLLASGMALWIAVQTVVNMAAMTGLGPLTGIPLPLVSYGSSSMLMLLAGIGLATSVADRAA
jgi:cell division protein FtsW